MLTDAFNNAKSVTFVDYTGMSVAVQQDLRNQLRNAGSQMFVTKNTLTKIAGKNANLPEEAINDEVLVGQTALIVGNDDAVSPIQILGKFSKENEVPHLKAGIVEGIFQNKEGLIKISKMPNKEQLQANVVGAIGAPIYGLLGTLQGNLQKLVYVLDQAKMKGGD